MLADLAVNESVRYELKHLDLAHRRFLVELAQRCGKRGCLGGAVRTPGSSGLEAPAVVPVTAQDLLTLGSVHGLRIGLREDAL